MKMTLQMKERWTAPTSLALILILAFAMTFATNSRPTYALAVSSVILLIFGFLAFLKTERVLGVMKDSALLFYLTYVGLAFAITLLFSNQLFEEALRCALILTGYGAIYALSASLCKVSRLWILWGVSTLVSLLAIYGLAAHQFPELYLSEKVFNHHAITATFTNPNHFATLLGFAILTSLTLLVTQARLHFLAIIFVAICSYTLLQTGSRAGLAATFLGLVGVLFLSKRSGYIWGKNRLSSISLALYFISIALLAWLFIPSVTLERFTNLAEHAPIRLALYQDVLAVIAQSPLTGYGLGSFKEVFRATQSEAVDVNLTWRSAHSAPLEIIFETGVVVAILPLVAGTLLLKTIFKTTRSQPEPQGKAAFGVLITAAFHALFDNSLATPAVGITTACVLGLSQPTRSLA
jgi:O-antigen ligase